MVHVCGGTGPMPAGCTTLRVGANEIPTVLMRMSVIHSVSAGSATSSPMVATIFGTGSASARGKKMRRFSKRPRSGANTNTEKIAAGTTATSRPLWSW